MSKRLRKAREELAVADEQLSVLSEAADEARIRSLVSETPLAARQSQEAERNAEAMQGARRQPCLTGQAAGSRDRRAARQAGPRQCRLGRLAVGLRAAGARPVARRPDREPLAFRPAEVTLAGAQASYPKGGRSPPVKPLPVGANKRPRRTNFGHYVYSISQEKGRVKLEWLPESS